MLSSLSRWSRRIAVVIASLVLIIACDSTSNDHTTAAVEELLAVDTVLTLSDLKLSLTEEYCLQHYGFRGYKLDAPKMIVVHHTVIPTLEETIALFKRDHLASNRTRINNFSSLNVGIHYVIDKDGAIYNLLPDSIIARHIIGFNHVSLGIENVAVSAEDLTEAQLESNISLINLLAERHSSVEFLIGHDEYNDRSLPHFELFTAADTTYQPYDKPDPGIKFMTSLRDQLMKRHGLEFKK